MRCYLVLVACLGLAQVGWGQSLVDNFNGTTINTSVWNTFNPSFGNGGLSQSSGVLTFRNGSYVTTVNEFNMPIISGRFSFSGWEYDRFNILLRSDGVSIDSGWQVPIGGLRVQFTPSSNPDYGASQTLHFYDLPNGYNQLGSAAPYIAMNTYYDFKIVDTGNLISVFWDNNTTPIFSYATSVSYGNIIQIGNREQAAGSGPPPYFANLDWISIIPEPSSLSLLALGGVLVALGRPKKQ